MKRTFVILTLSVGSLLGCGKSETSDGAATTHSDTTMHSTSQQPSTHSGMGSGSMDDQMRAMNLQMVQHMGPADAEYDHRFIDMMIPHHEGAIMMAKDALQKSQRPEIKKLAEDIIAAQEKEIAQLKAWGEAWYHKH